MKPTCRYTDLYTIYTGLFQDFGREGANTLQQTLRGASPSILNVGKVNFQGGRGQNDPLAPLK